MKATELRSNIYKVLDRIAKTGLPVQIERKGQIFELVPKKKKSKLDNLKERDCIVGDPEDLTHIDWTHLWTGPEGIED